MIDLLFASTALHGKHVLITGATGGIGYETAKMAAACGATVSITGRNESKLVALYERLKPITDESKIAMFAADMGFEDDRLKLIEYCEGKLGVITGLVNAAGIAENIILDELDEEKLGEIMHLNYTSSVLLTKEIYKKMKEQRKGAIVNVASLSGLRGTYGGTAYASSKFALIGFTQSLALEAIKSNINVNAVCPGFVDTPMARQLISKKAEEAGIPYEEQMTKIETGFPSGRLTTPEEVATTIIFMLSGAVGNLVGESIKISGGVVV
ncbi:SDR family NAD(P)-dependent oxidoreductase [Bacillus sp. MRMR6]|uniref:SDR family NAD(P)-dependent oxidoreductase n=1 Tax=Bacillus sp. MRMR6 TaxID=1928617 RepID=UPI000952DC86|nr:SDR family oxidoreductase [Bacillus sp. MRMR6]OLS40118.1 short-chain dehydrogenase [Bacillus sp. MRMR6]